MADDADTIRPDVLIEALRRTGYDRLAYLGRTCGTNERASDEYRRLLGLIESIPGVRPRNPSLGERASRFTHDVFGPSRMTMAVRVCAVLAIIVASVGLFYYRNEATGARAEAVRAHESSADKFERSIIEFRKTTVVWDAKSYRHLADQLANLFATPGTDAWKPAAPEQLQFVVDWSRWSNPENTAKVTDLGRTTPVAVRYYATWYWGMAEGLRRVRSAPRSLEYFARAVTLAESGFGPADALTLEVRTQYALALHGVGRDVDALAVIDEGDRRCREAIDADPSILDIKSGKGFNEAWGRLISLCAALPPTPQQTRPEDGYWSRRIEICKKYPLHVHPNYWPTFQGAFADYYFVTRHDKNRTDDERILRQKLAPAPGPGNGATIDRAVAQIDLAAFLRKQKLPNFAEAEELLTAATKTLKPLTELPWKPIDGAAATTIEPWDREYDRALKALVALYGERRQTDRALVWGEESVRFRRLLKEKYPKMRFPN